MKRVWNSFLIAFSMFSRIPMPRADWDKGNMRYMICFFPCVGLAEGLFVLGYGKLCAMAEFGSLMRAAGYVLLPALVTGGIHLDGFLDTVDALSSCQSRERKLEILKDSHAGAFAIIMGCAYFMLALGVWSEMPQESLAVMSVSFVLSRTLSGLAMAYFPCANQKGSLGMFVDAAQKKTVRAASVAWLIGCAAAAFWQDPRLAVILLGTAATAYAYYYHMAMTQFGGITGDLAGYFVQVCELACACTVMLGGRLL